MDFITSLGPWITGPAAAVVIMFVVLYGIYKIIDTRLLPLLTAAVERHLGQVDKLIASHDADRGAFAEALQMLQENHRRSA